ncbi:MAG: methyltransferase [Sphingobacteriaceae bacterium]|nr:methyltransferase [Sphingobacteriaceae bacterium]
MKTPITYYGGKQNMIKHLLDIIPAHTIYCEPFFGGGALFFAKPKSEVEIINDKNGEVINFFKVVKTKFAELQKEIQGTLHSREHYKKAMVVYEHPDLFTDVKRAWALWVLTNQGFASMIGSWGFGKENSKEKSLANKRDDFTRAYADRLRMVQIENNDAIKVIQRSDTKDTFIYADPPYIGSDMGHYKGYSEEDYKKLLDALVKVKGKFLLSSYPSLILSQYIKKYKWKIKKVEKSVAVTKHTDKKKTEMLVMNYDPEKIKAIVQTVKPSIKNISVKNLESKLKRLKFAA